jgi:hypothetical protein
MKIGYYTWQAKAIAEISTEKSIACIMHAELIYRWLTA